jgi:hypothetical protein
MFVIGIATGYGLDGLRIDSRSGARFSAPVQTALGAHPVSYRMGAGSLSAVKRPWRGTSSRAEVKEKVELYLY